MPMALQRNNGLSSANSNSFFHTIYIDTNLFQSAQRKSLFPFCGLAFVAMTVPAFRRLRLQLPRLPAPTHEVD